MSTPAKSHAAARHSGRHSAPPRPRPSRRRVALLGLAVLLAIGAWLALVYLAIQFGPAVRSGDREAWTLLGTATLGAVLCLFLALVLGAKLAAVLRARARPASVPGGRRIKRRAS